MKVAGFSPSLEFLEFINAVAMSIGTTMQVPKAAGNATRRKSPADLCKAKECALHLGVKKKRPRERKEKIFRDYHLHKSPPSYGFFKFTDMSTIKIFSFSTSAFIYLI